MNVWQTCRQLKNLLAVRAWPSSSELVFAAVIVTPGVPAEAGHVFRFPVCTIRPLEAVADENNPGVTSQQLEVTIVQANAGDPTGEQSLIGGNRSGSGTAGQGSSQGRGLLEIEEQLLAVANYLDQQSGIRLYVVRKTAAQGATDPAEGYVSWRSIVFSAKCSTTATYESARSLTATAPGGGVASLAWKNPANRYDSYQMILRRASGSTAPASATAGTGVSLAAAFSTSKSDTPGAGTWSYSLWCAYDETSDTPATAERYSDAGATVTVVVT